MSCLADDKIVYKLNFVKISTIYCYKRKHYTMRVFGQIKGIKQGDIFKDRATLAKVGVHPPVQAGISGSQNEGADSIVLSGGYEDDRDYGNIIIYTGAGGRDESSGKQIRDQELTRNNLALAKSKLDNLPVRVTRGASHKSKYSPAAGYRYAGLYKVVDYWCDIGSSGFKVWRYRLELFHGSYESDDGIVFDDEDKIHESKRKASLSNRIVRDKVLADKIKKLYKYKCQVCNTALVTNAGLYAEAAHIKPLGSPHNGPDKSGNLLCLCPNHHVLLDNGGFTIENDYTLTGIDGKLMIHKSHSLDLDCIKYHRVHCFK